MFKTVINKPFICLCLCLLLLTACGAGEQGSSPAEELPDWTSLPAPDWSVIPEQLPESMKGYELYSWQSGSTRVYTLITGTNSEKAFSEITAVENTIDGDYLKISVANLDDLKTLLSRLPAAEEVFWGGIDLAGQVNEGTVYFSYPAEKELNEILHYSQQIGIDLHTIHDQPEGEQ
ncbi:MAG TPA: hypothetical protein PKK59_10980 [Anaerolineaceae bacterium]|nr:hypothetical protein [Anaerolineaceae bacterium]